MAPLEVKVTIRSAKNLKNVNWRNGDLKPYAVVWVDPAAKVSTRVDDSNDTDPVWDDKLTIPLHDRRVDDSTLFIDIVHANAETGTKPLVGSTRVPLAEIVDEVGLGRKSVRSLKLKRPSGRPQGKLEVEVEVREFGYYAPPPGSYPAPYGQPAAAAAATRDSPYSYGAPPTTYGAPPPSGYPYTPSPYGQAGYGQPAYGQAGYGQPAYGQEAYGAQDKKKGSKFGMGTGLAVGAAAGLLGGLAIAEGVDYVEDKIAKDAAEKVEKDLCDYGGDDE